MHNKDQPSLPKTYEFPHTPLLTFTVLLENGSLTVSSNPLRRKKRIAFSDIRYFHLKKQMGNLGQTKLSIHHGTNQKTSIILQSYDVNAAALMRDLHALFPESGFWKNDFEDYIQQNFPNLTYPLSCHFNLPMNRPTLLLLSLLFVFPLFFYLILSRSYLLHTFEGGFTIKKFRRYTTGWYECKSIRFTTQNFELRRYGMKVGSERFLEFNVEKIDGTNFKFYLSDLQAAPFLKILIRQKKLPAEVANNIAV